MKVTKLLFLLVLFTGYSSTKAQNPTREQLEQAEEYARNNFVSDSATVAIAAIPVDSLAQQILAYSDQFLGTPYRYGATGPKSFDCSGFTAFVFGKFGYKISHRSKSQINEGQRVDKEEMKPGDLIFFTGRSTRNSPGHVGIVVENYGNGNIRFIHAATRGGVRYDELNSDYYAKRYITGLRVI